MGSLLDTVYFQLSCEVSILDLIDLLHFIRLTEKIGGNLGSPAQAAHPNPLSKSSKLFLPGSKR